MKGDSEAVPIKAAEPAPRAGWLVSDQALADLMECCQACLNVQSTTQK